MMKKTISIILTIAMMLSVFAASTSAASTVIYGDVDGDGNVTSADARLVLRYSVNLENAASLAAKCKKTGYNSIKAADVNADESVTAADARMILRASVNLEYKPSLGLNQSQIYLTHHFTMNCKVSSLDSELTCAYTEETVFTQMKMDMAAAFDVKDKKGTPLELAILTTKDTSYAILPDAKMAMDFAALTDSETSGSSSTLISLFDDALITGQYDLEPDRIGTQNVEGKMMDVYTFYNRDDDGEPTGGYSKHYMDGSKLVRVENYDNEEKLINTIEISSISATVPANQTSIPEGYTIAKTQGSAMLFMMQMLSLSGLTLADLGIDS